MKTFSFHRALERGGFFSAQRKQRWVLHSLSASAGVMLKHGNNPNLEQRGKLQNRKASSMKNNTRPIWLQWEHKNTKLCFYPPLPPTLTLSQRRKVWGIRTTTQGGMNCLAKNLWVVFSSGCTLESLESFLKIQMPTGMVYSSTVYKSSKLRDYPNAHQQ